MDSSEIDVRELLSTLKAYWVSILVCAMLAALAAGYYAFFRANPIFVSNAIFVLPESSNKSQFPSVEGLVGASLLGGGGGNTENIFDLIEGRDFILELADDLALREDPFFNTTSDRVGLRERIQLAVGLSEPRGPVTAFQIDESVVNNFRLAVSVGETDNRAFLIKVRHSNSERAAEVANAIMRKVQLGNRDRRIAEQREKVEYLSGELRKAQEEIDAAAQGVREFAVINNLLSQEELALQSQKLVRMRDRAAEIVNAIEGLEALLALLEGSSRDPADIDLLRDRYSGLNSRDLQQRLGNPETAAAWFALDPALIRRVAADLRRNRNEIERSLSDFQNEVAVTASSATELAALERRVKVANATYEVLLGQFEQQALLSGLDVSLGRVFQTAVPPVQPESPRKMRIVLVGFVVGLFLGILQAYARARGRDSLYSRDTLSRAIRPRGRLLSRRKLRRFAFLPALFPGGTRRRTSEVAELAFALNAHDGPVLVVPDTRREAPALATLVAGQMSLPDSPVVIVDFFGLMPRPAKAKRISEEELFVQWQIAETVHVARPPSWMTKRMSQLVMKPDFGAELRRVLDGYGRGLLLIPPASEAGYMIDGLQFLDPLLLTSFHLGRSRRPVLDRVLAPRYKGAGKPVLVVA